MFPATVGLFAALCFANAVDVEILPDGRSAPEKPGTLFHAALAGLEEACLYALENGADVNEVQVDEDGGMPGKAGMTPLHAAAASGHAGVASLLLEWGSSTDTVDSDGHTPLFAACRGGHLEVCRLLAGRADATKSVRVADKHGVTPLHGAALRKEPGFRDVAQLLIERGAVVDQEDKSGWAPLFLACWRGVEDTAELLLARGASVDKKNGKGMTPLAAAASKGHADVAKLLLRHGASAAAIGEDGQSPLHAAALRGHAGLVELLLEHGADRRQKDSAGRTALDVARLFKQGTEITGLLLLSPGGTDDDEDQQEEEERERSKVAAATTLPAAADPGQHHTVRVGTNK